MIANDPWILYRDLRDEFVELATSLSTEELHAPVALTPGWTGAQMLAHVCGLNVEVVGGAREGLGTDEATSRQVAMRAHLSLEEIAAEWMAHGDGLKAIVAELPVLGFRLSADLVVHLHDLQHSVGRSIDSASPGSMSGGNTYASRIVDPLAETAGVALTIELSDGNTYSPSGGSARQELSLRCTPYDALRSITGRRSYREVEALDWSAPPGALLDALCPYGPLRSEDAGV